MPQSLPLSFMLLILAFAWHTVRADEALVPSPSVEVDGTEFVLVWPGQEPVRSRDLAGTVLAVRLGDREVALRIAAVERDPLDPTGTVWLHSFEGRDDAGNWQNLCAPDPQGRRLGFPLQRADGGGIGLFCSAGVIAKCVRTGYRPWATDAEAGPLAPFHAACVRLMRADYGGSDEPWTRNGMPIDIYDIYDSNLPERAASDQTGRVFEAGWTKDGAVCVHHVRVQDKTTLGELERRYPRLAGRTGAVCTEAFARAHGAVLFNRSKP